MLSGERSRIDRIALRFDYGVPQTSYAGFRGTIGSVSPRLRKSISVFRLTMAGELMPVRRTIATQAWKMATTPESGPLLRPTGRWSESSFPTKSAQGTGCDRDCCHVAK